MYNVYSMICNMRNLSCRIVGEEPLTSVDVEKDEVEIPGAPLCMYY